MYKNKFVLAVKNSKGRVLRDSNNQVGLPWYEEYKLLLKNQHSEKAVATISIDGEDVLNGNRAIIPANGTFEIERFLNNNMQEGRKLQFVPAGDSRISHKKDSGELGIVEVVFRKEKINIMITPNPIYVWPSYPEPTEPLRTPRPWRGPYYYGEI